MSTASATLPASAEKWPIGFTSQVQAKMPTTIEGVPFRTSATKRTTQPRRDRKSTRLNSSHGYISYAVFCLKKKNFDVISLSSLRLTTLTKTFTCLEAGVKSLTFVIALSSMFSLLPTQDARVAKAGKTVSSRIQTLWADYAYETLL